MEAMNVEQVNETSRQQDNKSMNDERFAIRELQI